MWGLLSLFTDCLGGGSEPEAMSVVKGRLCRGERRKGDKSTSEVEKMERSEGPKGCHY